MRSRTSGRMPAVAAPTPTSRTELVAAEIAAVWRVSDRTVQVHLEDATTLVTRFPATLASLQTGKISRYQAQIIADAGDRIERPGDASGVRGRDPSLRRSGIRITPPPSCETSGRVVHRDHHRRASRDGTRQAAGGVTDLDDGMAQLVLLTAATLAHGIYDRVSQSPAEVVVAEKQADAEGCRLPRATLLPRETCDLDPSIDSELSGRR